MKKFLIGLFIGLSFVAGSAYALSIFTPSQGGTGIGSATAGDVGNCFVVTDDSPFTVALGSCGSSGGAAGVISTTTPLVNTQVVFSTGVASIGNDSAFTWNSTADRLTFTYGSSTVQTITNAFISKMGNLASAGFVKTSSDGTLSVDTTTYLSSITSGNVTTALGYTPLNQALYYSTTTHTTLTTIPNLSITKSQVSDFGTYQAPISLTTTGTSGAATFIANTLNIPQYAGTTYTATYPVTLTGSAFGLAFGTTTSNTWAGTQTFTNQITGSISGNAGTATALASNGANCSAGSYPLGVDASGAVEDCTVAGTGSASAYEIATTSTIGVSQLSYFTNTSGRTTLGGVATSTLSATSPLTGSFTQVGTGGALGIQVANTSQGGYLSSTDWNTFNGKQATLVSGTNIKTINGSSILGSGDLTVTGGSGLSSSSPWTVGNVAYVTGLSTVGSVATGTVSSGTGISVTAGQSIIGSGLTITNTAPDQTVAFTNGTGISVTGTYPNFTVTNTGSTFAFPFTVNTGYNSTSTVIGFNGLFSTASSTFSSALRLTSLSQGSLYVGSTGLVNTVATTSLTATAPIALSQPISVFGGSASAITCATASASVAGCLAATDFSKFNSATTTFGSGYATTTLGTLTFSTTTVTTNGQTLGVKIVPTAGALTFTPTITGTLDNTGLTNSTISGVGLGSALAALTATDSTLTFSGSYTGATARTVGLNLGNANTWTVNQTFNYSSSTVYSSFVTASTTFLRVGLADGCLNITSGLVGTTGSACGSGGGLSSYDAWTHPATGYSATTSALTISSTATSTFAGRLSVGTTSVSTLASATFTVKGLMASVMQIFTSAGTKIMDITDSAVTLLGTWDFSGATVKQHTYATFAYSTSTAWTATTTIALGVAFNAEAWNQVKCYTDVGTLNVSVYDGTNRMNMFNASTTIGTVTLSTNNTFTASEKRYIDIGTPASSPTKISCTTDVTVNN